MTQSLSRTRLPMGIAALIASAPLAGAQIAYTQDLRSVDASSGLVLADAGGGDSQVFNDDHADMPDPLFGAFDASELALILGPGGNTATALAAQDAEALESGFNASGLVETQVNLADAAPGSSATASASSVCSMSFTVPDGVFYQIAISGTLRAESPDEGGATAATARAELWTFDRAVFAGNGTEALEGLINVGPGTYTLDVVASSEVTSKTGNPGQSEADYSIAIQIVGEPCRLADVAEPFGALDLRDISVFVNGYLTQSGISDLADPIGVLCLQDINAFIQGFLAGCP